MNTLTIPEIIKELKNAGRWLRYSIELDDQGLFVAAEVARDMARYYLRRVSL